MALTERRAQILRLVVSEYIKRATPVGSETISQLLPMALSPATIRNEMAALEEEGYITHPHTSAARIPSDEGYRYYVEALMEEEDVPEADKQVLRLQLERADALDAWPHLTAAVIANGLRNLAMVTPPRLAQTSLRWLNLVPVHDLLALMVIVLREARTKERMLPLPRPYTPDELTVITERLNNLFGGLTALGLRRLRMELSPVEEQARQAVAATLEEENTATGDTPHLDGLLHLLNQPELRQPERMLALLDILDEHNLSKVIPLMTIARGDRVRIVIGHENPDNVLNSYSVIVSRYGVPDGPAGVIGVLGPTRMHYDRAVPMVRYMASLLSELTASYYS
jgi:heat-inducible transcriptional repressor